MDNYDQSRQQLISAVLAFESQATPAEAVRHAVAAWTRLAANLSPIIGDAGFCALYGRALRLVSSHYAWLEPGRPAGSIDGLFAGLRDRFAAVDPVVLDKANATLLDTFTSLLSGLIGEGLTTQIMNTAWVEQPGENKVRERSKK